MKRARPKALPEGLPRENDDLRRRLAEAERELAALREESRVEPVYRRALESMAEAVLHVTPEGRILFCNERFARLVARPLAELPGREVSESLMAEDQAPFGEWLRECRGDGAASQRVVFRGRDGNLTACHLNGRSLQTAAGTILCLVASDLTELERFSRQIAELRETQVALRKAVGALRVVKDRYRMLFDRNPDGVFLVDAEGRFTLVNAACETISGYSRGELSGKRFSELCAPDQGPATEEVFQKGLTDPAYREFETAIIRKDGARVALWVAGEPVEDNGRIVALHCTAKDITARRRTEEAVRDSEERFRAMFHRHKAAKLVIDPQTGAIVDANAAAAQFYGYPREQLCALRIDQINLLPPEEVAAERQRALAEERNYFEFPHRLASGEARWVQVYSTPVPVQGRPLLYSIIFDVTERKRVEAELRDSHARMTKVLEVETVGVMFWDLSTGRMTDANDTFLRMMGYSRAEVAAGELTWQRLTPPEYHDVSLAEVRKFQATGRVGPYEKEYLRKDGSRQWLVFAGSALGENSCVEFCVDISERKQAQAALEAALQEKDVLLHEVHHRVKNNLQVISSLVSLQTGSVTGPERSLFENIRDQVRAMALVHEKLYREGDFGRIEFADYARALLEQLWRAHGVAAKRAALELDLCPVSVPLTMAVPCGLILNELAGNALKHAFPDGRAGGRVRVMLASDPAGLVRLRVADDGVGLPEALDLRATESLGLRLVHLLAGQLRGTLEFRPAEAGGTEFELSFPSKTGHERTSPDRRG